MSLSLTKDLTSNLHKLLREGKSNLICPLSFCTFAPNYLEMAEYIPVELGTEKIGKLLKQYALPAIIAMTATSLYNMVDSIYIGQGCGPLAISGLAITFPLMNLSTAFGTLIGLGGTTLISMLLGQKNYDIAKRVLGNIFMMNILIGFLFAAVALIFIEPILTFFGASEATMPYAKDYMTIVLSGNIITHLYFGLNGVVRASGRPKKAMTATLLAVILNCILDPIFIFVLKMGIQGAALATVIAQIVSFIWIFKILTNKNDLLHFSKNSFHIDGKIIKRMVSIGVSPFLMNTASCFVVILINNQLKRYGGDLYIGAYGIINRIVFIFVMICIGLNQGMQPIAGYNYGAKLYQRVIDVLKLTIKWATMVTTLCFIFGMFFPNTVVSIFTSDPELKNLATEGLRITVMVMPLIGAQIVTTHLFQSLGLVNKSIFLSLSRQLLFLLPALIVLPLAIGVTGVWYAMPISDFISAIFGFILLASLIKSFKKEMAVQNSDKTTAQTITTK